MRLQLEVASGGALPPETIQPRFAGHAVECRIYAEDPGDGYLPQSGSILLLREPSGSGIRIDSALADGQEITVYFDLMLAKIATWGRDRSVAIARMRKLCAAAPIPGKVPEIPVRNGDKVEAGQVIMVISAMKMQLKITAPHAGVVRGLGLAVGDLVNGGSELLMIEALDG